jgi:hypothetical protein
MFYLIVCFSVRQSLVAEQCYIIVIILSKETRRRVWRGRDWRGGDWRGIKYCTEGQLCMAKIPPVLTGQPSVQCVALQDLPLNFLALPSDNADFLAITKSSLIYCTVTC